MVRNSTRLIELVRARPCLYDRAHPMYLNVGHKRELWDAIARELALPAAKCKTRWNNMRDSYRKATLKNARGYKYARHLSFLHAYLRTETPLDAPEDEPGEPKEEAEWEDDGSSGWEEPAREFADVGGYFVPAPEPLGADAVDAFLAGIAPALKALGGVQLSLAKMEIYQVVHKYELRALQAAAAAAGGAAGAGEPGARPAD